MAGDADCLLRVTKWLERISKNVHIAEKRIDVPANTNENGWVNHEQESVSAGSICIAQGSMNLVVYGKTRDGVSSSVLRKVSAPWGRGDLSAVTSGYSISGFAIGDFSPAIGAKCVRVMKPQTSKIKLEGRTGRMIACALFFLSTLVVFLILWQLRPVPAQGQTRSPLRVSSASFSNGGAIPRQFTCDGADASPSLQWSATPYGTRSFALVMNDPDAPFDFTHWIAYNIPPAVRGLAEGASTRGAMPKGSAEGINDFTNAGYGGPCPPAGKPHHYVFRIYALDVRLDLPPGATRKQLDSVIERHIVGEGQIAGVYRRASPVAR